MADEDRLRPLYSSRADDPELCEALDAFVVSLAERIDLLQDTEAASSLKDLASRAHALAGEARGLGYDSFADVADLVGAASEAADAAEARKQLVELTELSQRIRLGHRGAL